MAADACLPACTVLAHTVGFAPPLVEVASGGTLFWQTLDVGHTSSDRADLCLHTAYGAREIGRARFLVQDGLLHAAGEDAPLEPCPSATALADGSFVLGYECFLHPNMQGTIIVR